MSGILLGSVLLLSTSVSAQNLGQWSNVITFPLVPCAVASMPNTNGQLLVWSAFDPNSFETGKGRTQTAYYNPSTGRASGLLQVSNTKHDMFCPGSSFDFDGNLIVTGGNDNMKTSIFNQGSQGWLPAPDMKLARGYQSSTILDDGRVFQVGGSWTPPEQRGGKQGEIWNGTQWSLMSGIPVEPMLTADPGGIFRQDNHVMIWGWSNNTVFHAGPSRAMHWLYMQGQGRIVDAGTRGSDSDAMCGPAVMYDATKGQILVTGGSTAYENAWATSNAHLVTIGRPGEAVGVEKLANMAYRRIFATSTVLPNGQVFVVGGQEYGIPFSDSRAVMTPELWDPTTKRFTQMSKHRVPRTYHSISTLMMDGTVFVGGGGLCGGCSTNHFDGEIWTPPYLFQSNGRTKAARPTITAVSTKTLKVGSSFTASVTRPSGTSSGTWTFSLLRLSSSTHTVNTDQRRVPLTPTSSGNNQFTLQLPSDPGVLTPGYWWLFAMFNGVPSTATEVLINL